ncbi:helix-turn-helix domain-containing protein, partial [Parapedobacter deserti]
IRTNLIRFRAEKRYSQREIAQVLSISQPSYNQMETGHTRVAASQLYALANFYGISVQLFYVENPTLNGDCERLSEAKKALQEQVAIYQAAMEIYQRRFKELESRKLNREAKRSLLKIGRTVKNAKR